MQEGIMGFATTQIHEACNEIKMGQKLSNMQLISFSKKRLVNQDIYNEIVFSHFGQSHVTHNNLKFKILTWVL